MDRRAQRGVGLGTSIFTEVSALAVQCGAVNLGQGFPDFPAPAFIKDAAVRAIAADRNQYAPASGLPRLRAAVADHFRLRHGLPVNPDTEVTITSGATEAICSTILALIDPGDEVIVFEPAYDVYVPAIRFAGGIPRPVALRAPDWRFDPAEVAAAFSPRTRAVVINTPHNPTGKVFSTAELDLIASLCVQHDVVVISDEVYSEITFDDAVHVPICTRPGMACRTVTIDSIGKTFGVTGWKVGWTIAAPDLTQAIRGIHQFVTFCVPTPLQEAAADGFGEGTKNGYFDELRSAYRNRRDRLSGILSTAGLVPLPIGGAYFLLTDISTLGFSDDTDFCRRLTTEIGVAAIPTSAFFLDPKTAPPLARFCFAKHDDTLTAAAARLPNLRNLRG